MGMVNKTGSRLVFVCTFGQRGNSVFHLGAPGPHLMWPRASGARGGPAGTMRVLRSKGSGFDAILHICWTGGGRRDVRGPGGGCGAGSRSVRARGGPRLPPHSTGIHVPLNFRQNVGRLGDGGSHVLDRDGDTGASSPRRHVTTSPCCNSRSKKNKDNSRTCLSKAGSMTCLFNKYNFEEVDTKISEMIISCAAVQICEGDGLPEQVCGQCFEEILRAVAFRKLCEESDASLREDRNSLLKVQNLVGVEPENDHPINLTEFTNDVKQENLDDSMEVTVSVVNKQKQLVANTELNLNEASGDGNMGSVKQNSIEKVNEEVCGTKEEVRRQYQCPLCGIFLKTLLECSIHINEEHDEPIDPQQDDSQSLNDKEQNQQDDSQSANNNEQNQQDDSQSANNNEQNQQDDSQSANNEEPNQQDGIKSVNNEKPNQQDGIKSVNNEDQNSHGFRTCGVCNYNISVSNFSKHMATHSGERRFGCEVCSKRFKSKRNLESHRATHSIGTRYLCNFCGKIFNRFGYFKKHVAIHTGDKPHECDACGKRFSDRSDLKLHERTHTGERPYRCDTCGQCFRLKIDRNRHVRKHGPGEKMHECRVCHQRFMTSSGLIVHMKSKHANERPFGCKDCGKAFVSASCLGVHSRTHWGERPHVCIVCGRGYKGRKNLTIHMKVHELVH